MDLPHLFFGTATTPINWVELIIEIAFISLVGLSVIFILHVVEFKRAKAEEKLKHINLVLCAIRGVNQLIIHEKDRDELIQKACDILISTRGYTGAWLVLLDTNQKFIKSARSGFCDKISLLEKQMKQGKFNRCGRLALRQQGVVIIENPESESECKDCPLLGEQAECRAMTIRLEHKGKIYGLLSVKIPEDFAGDKEEQGIFEELAGDIEFALYNIGIEEEKKKVEEKLREANTIINRSPAVIFTWKNEEGWPVEYVSENAGRIFGYTAEDFISGKVNYAKCIHPDDLERVGKEVGVFSKEEGRNEFVHEPYRIITKDGKEKIVTNWTFIVRDQEGKFTHYKGIIEDITERKLAEEALQKSEARLKEAEKLALLGYWELDLQENVLYWSDEIYRIFEIDPSRFKASYEAFLNTVHPDDRELVNRAYTESAKNRTPYSIDHRILLKDGRIKFVHEQCETYYDEQSNAVRSLGTVQDITERKKAEEKIKYLGFHDSLTDLYNRAYFEEEMKRLNTQRKYPLSVVMADINGLKVVNDALGYNKGDELLKNLAKVLKSIAREGDIVARIGGDEFAVILPHSNENTTQAFCNRFRDACEKYNSKTQLKLSVALGYAIQSGQYENMEKLLEQADENMYTEKLSDTASREKHIIDTLKIVLAVRDPHTGEHAERLQDLAEALGKGIGLSGFELKRLRLLALLHDIGKIGTPDNILFKPDKLTGEEWEVMKKHSEDGYKMAGNIPQLYGIAEAILYHHERWDGTGYPKGLKGEEIPILSRIISIVDAYDVVLTERPYKKAMTEEEAIKELKENAGTQFDPELVEKFLKIKVNKE